MSSKNSIDSIQVLRGTAAVLVVFCHSMQFISVFLPSRLVHYTGQGFGNFGVDIFFVLSGFIMSYIHHDQFGSTHAPILFLKRRILRIYPLYWVICLITLLIIVPSGIFTYAFPADQYYFSPYISQPSYLISSFLLIPYYTADGYRIAPFIGIAWTLIYEMFFYSVFAILLMFKKKHYLYIMTLLFISLVALNVGYAHLRQPQAHTNFLYNILTVYGDNIVFEFLYGCLIAECYLKGKLLSNKFAFIIILISTLILISTYHVPSARYWELTGLAKIQLLYHVKCIASGIPASLIVYSLLSLEAHKVVKMPNFLIELGNRSYTIYLIHFTITLPLIIVMIKMINHYISIQADVAIFVAWVWCVLVSYKLYKFIEEPIIKITYKLLRPRPNNELIIESN